MSLEKQTLFRLSYGGAALFYVWAIGALWIGPAQRLSGTRYLLIGVLPALFGVVCTITAFALHVQIREDDSKGSGDR